MVYIEKPNLILKLGFQTHPYLQCICMATKAKGIYPEFTLIQNKRPLLALKF